VKAESSETVNGFENDATIGFDLGTAHEQDPTSIAGRPATPRKPESRLMTLSQVEALFTLTDGEPVYDPIMLVLVTGLRVSEALKLKWSDVSLEGDHPYVVVRGGSSERRVSLPTEVVPLLHQMWSTHDEHVAELGGDPTTERSVLVGPWGTAWELSTFRWSFQLACRAAGIGRWTTAELTASGIAEARRCWRYVA